ncbi:MAG: hypothetical protein HYW10_07015 [Candidatus Omnitrophica bacterium]|nr:hypothetical protein [Candidatus Omnitrophota bacterium]
MAPGIGRSIREGFRVANRSWIGMGFVAACGIVIGLIALGVVLLMKPPAELFQPAPTPAEEVTAPTATPTAQAAPADAQGVDVFAQLGTAETAAPSAQEQEAASPPRTDAATSAREQAEQHRRVIGEWFGRSWPVLVLCALFLIAASIWLYGGQIGYLAKRVTSQHASVSEFWVEGTRAFWALLGASLLGVLLFGGGVLGIVLIAAVGSAMSSATPQWLLVLLGVVFYAAAFGGWIWLGVRLVFWFVAIVGDRVGPLAGFQASFRATRGRWWRAFGLVVLFVLIALGCWLPFGLLEAIGNLAGGQAALVAGLVSQVGSSVANLYVGFVSLAGFIRFYEDTKAPQTSAG